MFSIHSADNRITLCLKYTGAKRQTLDNTINYRLKLVEVASTQSLTDNTTDISNSMNIVVLLQPERPHEVLTVPVFPTVLTSHEPPPPARTLPVSAIGSPSLSLVEAKVYSLATIAKLNLR